MPTYNSVSSDPSLMRHTRWSSYLTQIRNVLKLEPQSVLEIGGGDGLFGHYIEKKGITYATVDMDASLNPTYQAELGRIRLPIADNSFDVVCAFQVLEHIHRSQLLFAALELARVSSKYIFISVPYSGIDFKLELKLPFLPHIHWHLSLPRCNHHSFETDGQHHWELGTSPLSLFLFRDFLTHDCGLTIIKEWSEFNNPKDRFFLLKKH